MVVDSDTAHFVATYIEDDGPYPTNEAAFCAGFSAAVEWFSNNQVRMDRTNYMAMSRRCSTLWRQAGLGAAARVTINMANIASAAQGHINDIARMNYDLRKVTRANAIEDWDGQGLLDAAGVAHGIFHALSAAEQATLLDEISDALTKAILQAAKEYLRHPPRSKFRR